MEMDTTENGYKVELVPDDMVDTEAMGLTPDETLLNDEDRAGESDMLSDC